MGRITVNGDPRRSRGFTLVGVVIAIAILTILIAAVGPTIATIMQRDREEELIFRGKQYARSILAFQRRYGRFPTSLKELFTNRPRTVRKLWFEPMCNCENWQIIIAGTPDALPMGQSLPPGMAVTPGAGLSTTPGAGNQPPSTYTGMFPPPSSSGGGAVPRPTPGGFPSLFGPGQTVNVGPIVGVRAKLHKKALRKWREKEYYDEWRFIAGDADLDIQPPFNPFTLGPKVTPTPAAP